MLETGLDRFSDRSALADIAVDLIAVQHTYTKRPLVCNACVSTANSHLATVYRMFLSYDYQRHILGWPRVSRVRSAAARLPGLRDSPSDVCLL